MINITDVLRPTFSESSKIAFEVFGIGISWYAIIIISGAILGSVIGYYCFVKKLGFSADLLYEGLAFGLLFGILGARLYYVLFSGVEYDSIWDVLNPRSGGLAIHGAIIAVAIYLPIFCKIRHIKLIYLLEVALPLIMLAQVIGRWGNFVNQEAFGGIIDVFGGIENLTPSTILTDEQLLMQREVLQKLLIPDFIIDRMYISSSQANGFICSGYYHPTFLYESLANLIGLSTYMIIRKYSKHIYVGDGVAFYLGWYGIVRFFIEAVRSDPLMLGNIRVAQLTSVIYFVLAVLIIVLRRVFKFRMITCKEALYGENSSILINKESLTVEKNE